MILPAICFLQVAEGALGGKPVTQQNEVSISCAHHLDRALQPAGSRILREMSDCSLSPFHPEQGDHCNEWCNIVVQWMGREKNDTPPPPASTLENKGNHQKDCASFYQTPCH